MDLFRNGRQGGGPSSSAILIALRRLVFQNSSTRPPVTQIFLCREPIRYLRLRRGTALSRQMRHQSKESDTAPVTVSLVEF